MPIIKGEIHSVVGALRDRALVASAASLLSLFRGERDAMVLDLLLEAHASRSDGGLSETSAELAGYAKKKLETRMAFWTDASGVHSMARATVYGSDKKRVAVLSAVATRASRRGRGLAKATISSLLEDLEIPVRLAVDDGNAPAKGLYKSLGFKPAKRGFWERAPV